MRSKNVFFGVIAGTKKFQAHYSEWPRVSLRERAARAANRMAVATQMVACQVHHNNQT